MYKLAQFQVGDVAFVELFTDDHGKPRGCGVVTFSTAEAAKKALSVMHRYELFGRKLVLKEEMGKKSNEDNITNIINHCFLEFAT